jgi:hypothetical protein
MANQPNKDPKVGESTTRRGEDVEKEEGNEAGRYDSGPQGPSERPTGKSTPRDTTGVDPADADPRSRKRTEDAD